MKPLLLVYGGTFDPVHRGHVAVALAAADATKAERVLLIPCGDPPHRPAPTGSGALRAELLRLAFAFDRRFEVDERELRRPGPSYMADTLADLRHEIGPDAPLALLLGMDAAQGLPWWERWTEIANRAHLVLVPRPGEVDTVDPQISALWPTVVHPAELRDSPAGRLLNLPEAVSETSSTASRLALRQGQLERADLPLKVATRLARGSAYRPQPGEVSAGERAADPGLDKW